MNPVRIGVRKPPKLAKVSVTPIIVPANIGATSDGLIFEGVVHDIHTWDKTGFGLANCKSGNEGST